MPHKYTLRQLARFWAKVDRSGGPDACWPWTASRRDGYGQFGLGRKWRPQVIRAHRMAFEIANDSIDPTLEVLHGCDNPPCCNPRHLRQGTRTQNAADVVGRGRQSRGERHAAAIRAAGMRGERHGSARLTGEQVLEIRARYRAGGTSLRRLAPLYGVSPQTISKIVRREKWSHI